MPRRTLGAIGLVLLCAQSIAAQTGSLPDVVGEVPIPNVISLQVPLPGGAQDKPATDTVFSFSDSGRTPRIFATGDYLLWWIHRGPAPALLTTAPNNGKTDKGLVGGILGETGTTALFTSEQLDYRTTSGFRVSAGVNLDADRFWSLEGVGFHLPRRSINYRAAGGADGTPLLTIPFLDAALGEQQALDISSQDSLGNPYLTGSISIHSDIQVWGYEVNFLAHAIRSTNRSFDLFTGYRALALDENLRIDQSITALQTGAISLQFPTAGLGQPGGTQGYYSIPEGGIVTVGDLFTARNRFYGGQVGGRFLWDFGRVSLDLTGKLAVGVTHQEVSINGQSAATAGFLGAGPVVNNLVTPGGVFALQFNSGTFSQHQFTVVPEVGLNASCALTSNISFRVGYGALYWSNVARPGAQIDPVLNSKLVPTAAFRSARVTSAGVTTSTAAFESFKEQGRPYFSFRDTAFWAHGVQFGVEIRY